MECLLHYHISTKKADHRAKRVERRQAIARAKRDGWRFISKTKRSYNLPQETWGMFPQLSIRGASVSSFDNFFKIVSFSFLRDILDSIECGTWKKQQEIFFQTSFNMLYKYFAIYIRIQGIYKVPVLCQRNGRPLRLSIDEARNYFRSIYPDDPSPCGKVLERLFTHFLISHEFYERLSTRFQGLMRSLGSSTMSSCVNPKQSINVWACLFSNHYRTGNSAG